jgi:catechol 2,3-dioxygenase-like lactoylglutathione lyase family enzyme
MSNELIKLLEAFDGGRLSRRKLLQALGAAAVLAPISSLAMPLLGDEQARGMGPLEPAPFEPTGWKTVLLDHLSCKTADLQTETACYNTLMNWPVRSSTAQESVLDIGDFGGIIIRGGYQPSADELAAEKEQYDRRAAAAVKRGAKMGPFVPRNTVFDSFCWGIDQWDARKVEAALKERGLNPVADNHAHDFQSFHVKDPDGFDIQISNGNRHNRRTTPPRGHLLGPAPFPRTDWKTVWIDHISIQCTDYRKSVPFYQALLGWQPTAGIQGTAKLLLIGDIGGAIIRNHIVRYRAVQPRRGEGGAREARDAGECGHERRRADRDGGVQEL